MRRTRSRRGKRGSSALSKWRKGYKKMSFWQKLGSAFAYGKARSAAPNRPGWNPFTSLASAQSGKRTPVRNAGGTFARRGPAFTMSAGNFDVQKRKTIYPAKGGRRPKISKSLLTGKNPHKYIYRQEQRMDSTIGTQLVSNWYMADNTQLNALMAAETGSTPADTAIWHFNKCYTKWNIANCGNSLCTLKVAWFQCVDECTTNVGSDWQTDLTDIGGGSVTRPGAIPVGDFPRLRQNWRFKSMEQFQIAPGGILNLSHTMRLRGFKKGDDLGESGYIKNISEIGLFISCGQIASRVGATGTITAAPSALAVQSETHYSYKIIDSLPSKIISSGGSAYSTTGTVQVVPIDTDVPTAFAMTA